MARAHCGCRTPPALRSASGPCRHRERHEDNPGSPVAAETRLPAAAVARRVPVTGMLAAGSAADGEYEAGGAVEPLRILARGVAHSAPSGSTSFPASAALTISSLALCSAPCEAKRGLVTAATPRPHFALRRGRSAGHALGAWRAQRQQIASSPSASQRWPSTRQINLMPEPRGRRGRPGYRLGWKGPAG